MLSRRGWSRATPVIAQTRTTGTLIRCLHVDMTMRPVAPVQLHLHHRQIPLYLLSMSG